MSQLIGELGPWQTGAWQSGGDETSVWITNRINGSKSSCHTLGTGLHTGSPTGRQNFANSWLGPAWSAAPLIIRGGFQAERSQNCPDDGLIQQYQGFMSAHRAEPVPDRPGADKRWVLAALELRGTTASRDGGQRIPGDDAIDPRPQSARSADRISRN